RDQEHTGRIEDRGARRSIGRRRVLRSQGDDERQQRAERGAEYRAHFGFTIAMPVAVSTGFTTGAVTAAAASGLPACSSRRFCSSTESSLTFSTPSATASPVASFGTWKLRSLTCTSRLDSALPS